MTNDDGERKRPPPERGKSVSFFSALRLPRPTDAEISFQFEHFISVSLFSVLISLADLDSVAG